MTGRPRLVLSDEQLSTIFSGLADGQSLRSICRDNAMPAISTIMKLLSEDAAFAEQYARARAAGDDAMAEDIQAIADDGELDPNDRRIRIDARKWLLAKRQPRKYGDKLDVEHGVTSELGSILSRVDGKTRQIKPTFEIV